MSNVVKDAGGGLGLGGVLTVLFVIFKIFGVINWSWWWVFAPTWIPIAFALTIYAFVFVVSIVAILLGVGRK